MGAAGSALGVAGAALGAPDAASGLGVASGLGAAGPALGMADAWRDSFAATSVSESDCIFWCNPCGAPSSRVDRSPKLALLAPSSCGVQTTPTLPAVASATSNTVSTSASAALSRKSWRFASCGGVGATASAGSAGTAWAAKMVAGVASSFALAGMPRSGKVVGLSWLGEPSSAARRGLTGLPTSSGWVAGKGRVARLPKSVGWVAGRVGKVRALSPLQVGALTAIAADASASAR